MWVYVLGNRSVFYSIITSIHLQTICPHLSFISNAANLSNLYHSCEDTRGISFEGRCCVEMEATNHRQQNHW